ncbi:MAG: ATP-dependent sacrificial sulfur transferase LarE [Acidimicrobiales bacterium]|nr:ATP-dependent sacrificial sulfur transferase LarE [Acidimicrobiales bacterium]
MSPTRVVAPSDPLEQVLFGMDRVVVAFSGGVDSALVAHTAHTVLGPDRAHVVTAVSPSLAGDERADAELLAKEWGLRWSAVETNEMAHAAYRANDVDRCAHCKDALMDVLVPIAQADSATVVLGVNLDDLGDHRPGQLVAAERGARFPLVEAGLNKNDVRSRSRTLGLRTADKPAAACLASRVPYGTEVTVNVLSGIERAEAALRRLGFDDLRVRHYDDTARIEVPTERLEDVVAQKDAVVAAVSRSGYQYVTLDLEGLRSGNLNAAL